MKKAARVLAVYLAGMTLFAALCFLANAWTPVMRDAEAIDVQSGHGQALIDTRGLISGNVCAFTFVADEDTPPLTLTVSDAGHFDLFFNGKLLCRYGEDTPYSRNIPVSLGVPLASVNRVEIRLSDTSREGELLLGPSAVVKLLLGTQEAAMHAENRAQRIISMVTGAYAMLVFSCLALFVHRRQERYLFALFIVSLASAAVMLVDVYAPLFISQRVYASIRSSLFICPVIFTAAIGFYLMIDLIPERIRRLLTLNRLFLVTAAIVVAQYFSRYNFNFALRAALLALLCPLFYRAALKDTPGVMLLAAGYGLCDGARMFVYLVNTLQVAHAGEWAIYLRVTQLGYLALLVLCMALVLRRYADKFTQAEQLNRRLDEIVERRTEQLSEANKRLRAAQEREREMTTHILHDLRTPLFHLQGYLDMADDEKAWNPQLLSDMRERLQYVGNLTENLFFAARLDGGRVSINCHGVDLTQICRELTDSMAVAAKGKELSLHFELDEGVRAVGDGFHIRQILQNLLDNAVQHTHRGGWVCVTLSQESGAALLKVSNSAVIPEGDLPHVFERFFHGSNSASSGLGLYIAQTLATQMQGSLNVRSGEGKTEFLLTLPCEAAREEGEDGEESPCD